MAFSDDAAMTRVTDFFGSDGNLYKPVADEDSVGSGNLVILLSSSYTEQFDSCTIQTITGETAELFCLDDAPFTQIPFSCFSNGDRQTWRANFTCDQVATIDVICRSSTQEVRFTVPETQMAQVCTRFG